uniref:Sulfate_transp domain-containing protein n=1 Tax=Heterorhabditis bacteriophora TaxID=37862 RepID=A0A1I7WP63_HETBA
MASNLLRNENRKSSLLMLLLILLINMLYHVSKFRYNRFKEPRTERLHSRRSIHPSVACGDALIGIIFYFIVSLITKYINQVRILAPVFIFANFSIAVCGMTVKQYVKGSIAQAVASPVNYFVKMLAQLAEIVIFMRVLLHQLHNATV